MRGFYFKKRPGIIPAVVVIVVAVLVVLATTGATAAVGDRTGAGYDGKIIGDSSGGGSTGDSDSGEESGEVTNPAYGCNNVPSFEQCDSQWRNVSYGCGGTTVCSAGCGLSAAAMVLKFYGKNVTPATMATLSLDNGYRVCGSGTSHAFFPFVASKYGLRNQNGISWTSVENHLKQGRPVIISGKGPSPFTSGGHYVVLTCYNGDGTIAVNDSASGQSHANKNYPISLLKSYYHFATVIYP